MSNLKATEAACLEEPQAVATCDQQLSYHKLLALARTRSIEVVWSPESLQALTRLRSTSP